MFLICLFIIRNSAENILSLERFHILQQKADHITMPITRKRSDSNKSHEDSCVLQYKRGNSKPNNTKKQKQLESLKTRDTPLPTWCDYGEDRIEKFPGFFFCHECRNWELRSREDRRANRKMKKYKCKGGHESFLVPTTKVKVWCPTLQVAKINITSLHDNQLITSSLRYKTNPVHLAYDVSELRARVAELESDVDILTEDCENKESLLDSMRTEQYNLKKRFERLEEK